MASDRSYPDKGRVIWVTGNPLPISLDAATWVETTRILKDLGWDVTLVSEGSGGWEMVGGIQVHTLPKPNVYALGRLVHLFHLMRYLLANRKKAEIVLFHQISAPWIIFLRSLSRLFGSYFPSLVMDTRDLNDYEGGVKNWFRVTYFKFAHILANKMVDGQTAITPKMVELIGIPESKLLTIWPSGVDLDRFASAQRGREWPQRNETIRLIYTGKIHSERKLFPLCKAVYQANLDGMSFIFTLLGDGLERRRVEEYALEAEGSIVVEPPVPHEQVPDFLRKCHIGVTPLPDWEDRKFESSNPIKMFEYMAAGMPVLATRNICHTSVVQGKDFAFWANDGELDDLYSALVSIWNRRHDLGRMGEDAAREAENWTWERSGTLLSDALERCLLGHRIERNFQPEERGYL